MFLDKTIRYLLEVPECTVYYTDTDSLFYSYNSEKMEDPLNIISHPALYGYYKNELAPKEYFVSFSCPGLKEYSGEIWQNGKFCRQVFAAKGIVVESRIQKNIVNHESMTALVKKRSYNCDPTRELLKLKKIPQKTFLLDKCFRISIKNTFKDIYTGGSIKRFSDWQNRNCRGLYIIFVIQNKHNSFCKIIILLLFFRIMPYSPLWIHC